ncbi:MAG: hypothetical protein IJE48_07430 [Clostridia bacterium]|nr:hypothetical protein [Clostridia bacterium]
MKNSIKIHRKSKHFLVTGTAAVIAVLFASTLLYLGAGRMFDYYIATDISEKLLAGVRPLSVAVCSGALGIEYFFKRKDTDKL